MSSHKFNCVTILAPLLTSFFTLSFAAPSFAQTDSVAIILRPDKVLIQINEAGSSSRLQSLFDVLQEESEFLFLSDDQSVKLNCARNAEAATCTIRLLPSDFVAIQEKTLDAVVPWEELNVESPPSAQGRWMFESSREDRLEIQVSSRGLRILGNKKQL